MENNLGDFLMLMQKDIIKLQEEDKMKNKKVLITPLMMDFGNKWLNDFPYINYKRLSTKPITDQVIDLLNGIREYIKKSKAEKIKPVLEIFPFLGVNTQNYPLHDEGIIRLRKRFDIKGLQAKIGSNKIKLIKLGLKEKYLRFHGKMNEREKSTICQYLNKADKDQIETLYDELNSNSRNTIKVLLDKYFKDFKIESKNERYKKLYNKMGEFNGNLDDKKEDYNYFFAGIKVYPPLGFNPWPDDPIELEKVKYMYDMCIKKNIPITSHCSTGGFQVIENKYMKKYVYYNWAKVLDKEKRDKKDNGNKKHKENDNFEKLKINLAHFGSFKYKYAKFIFELIIKHENVYTDFSYQCFKPEDYKRLFDLIEKLTAGDDKAKNKLLSRINFGSDFMINLLMTDSYYKYLNVFFTTNYFIAEKELFSKMNPENFLFK